MFDTSYIVAPLVGGVIGYITNALAIKMLFRPYTAKYLFGVKLPFTPGIIPKEKSRIAQSIGTAVSENLMSADVIERNLLSEDMLQKIHNGLTDFFKKQQSNDESLREFIAQYLSPEEVDSIMGNLQGEFSEQIGNKLANSHLGEKISDVVVQHVQSKLRVDGLDLDIPSMLKGFMGTSIWGKLADLISIPCKSFLSKSIDSMLKQHGQEIVSNLVTSESDKLLATPVSTLLDGKDKQIEQLISGIESLYQRLIKSQLPKILQTIDIPHIIKDRLNEMDMKETEQLIFKVMDKELKAIVWLGALLGLIMGCVNLLF